MKGFKKYFGNFGFDDRDSFYEDRWLLFEFSG